MQTQPLLARLPDVLTYSGLKRASLYEQIAAGTFPRPVKLSSAGRAVAFPVSEVREVLHARIAGQNDEQVRALVQRMHAARTVATTGADDEL